MKEKNKMSEVYTGKIISQIRLNETKTGKTVGSFMLATKKYEQGVPYKNREDVVYKVTVWEQMATNCDLSFSQFDNVIVHGKFEGERTFKTQSGEGKSLDVTAYDVGPSVRYEPWFKGDAPVVAPVYDAYEDPF